MNNPKLFRGRRRFRASARGLNLVEIIIVITILGLLLGTIGYFVAQNAAKAQHDLAQGDAQRIHGQIGIWKMQNPDGECPTIDELKKAKLLKADQEPKDPWGNSWKIVCADGDYVVTSPGKDKADPSDDIRYPAAKK